MGPDDATNDTVQFYKSMVISSYSGVSCRLLLLQPARLPTALPYAHRAKDDALLARSERVAGSQYS